MLPTFGEVRRSAIKHRKVIVCKVMMANDDIQLVRFGPRGGWSFIK